MEDIDNVEGLIDFVSFSADDTDKNDLFFCIWDVLRTGCGDTCLAGTIGVGDTSYSADDVCDGDCDANGEYWTITENV